MRAVSNLNLRCYICEPAEPIEVTIFDKIIKEHVPSWDTNSDFAFGLVWMTCSCGWDQDRDRVKNNYIEWEEHVREALIKQYSRIKV